MPLMPRTSRTTAALLLMTLPAAGGLGSGGCPGGGPRLHAGHLGVRPADTEQGSERPNYAYALDPGGRLSDALIVSNYDDEEQTFRVYGSDGFITEAGQLDLLPAAEPSTQLGSWIAFPEPEVTVPAGERAGPVRGRRPRGRDPGRLRRGRRLLDPGAGRDRSLGRPAPGLAHVPPRRRRARPRLSIDGLAVSYQGGWNPFAPGSATVDYTVTNAGNTRIAPGAEISVAGLFGLAPVSATDPEPLPELLPEPPSRAP